MNPYLLLKRFFDSEREVLEQPYEVFEPIPPEKPATASTFEAREINLEMTSPKSPASGTGLPAWLEDEDLLRDEGVIFGLTDALAEEKVGIIEAIFVEKSATDSKRVELLSEKIGELNLKLGQLEEKMDAKSRKVESYTLAEKVSHQLPKTATSLMLSGIMAIGNFFLIDNVFTVAFPDYHLIISSGVFLAGMFTLFSGISVLHHTGESPSFWQMLKELALPVSASVFVWTIAAGSMSGIRAFGMFLFVLSLFLYSGKLFLDNLIEVKEDFSSWLHNRKIRMDKQKTVGGLEKEIEEIRLKMDELRVEKWKIIPELSEAEGRVSQWNGRKDSLIQLFQSEFKLARSYRDKMSQSQIKRIVE